MCEEREKEYEISGRKCRRFFLANKVNQIQKQKELKKL